jgi:hypothetical protein
LKIPELRRHAEINSLISSTRRAVLKDTETAKKHKSKSRIKCKGEERFWLNKI